MKTRIIGLIMTLTFLHLAYSSLAQENPKVGGEEMYATKNIVENAVNSKDHTTLVAAVKQAGLVETLQSPGPFTVFAPTNKAFDALPKGTVETLMKDENKEKLTAVLTYHVVPGRIDSEMLTAMILENDGKYSAETVNGEKLSFTLKGNNIWVWDAQGNKAKVTIADVYQSNGVIHEVNAVLLP